MMNELVLKHDKKWTAEAIFNILDNAVKYTEVGGNIHIVVCRQELFTKISIEDTGKGIALERQATIFTRFYREPEVHDNDGIGIGLIFSKGNHYASKMDISKFIQKLEKEVPL